MHPQEQTVGGGGPYPVTRGGVELPGRHQHERDHRVEDGQGHGGADRLAEQGAATLGREGGDHPVPASE